MWLDLQFESSAQTPRHGHRVAIAIPARDEAEDIAACLMAIDASAAAAAPSRVEVVVLVNNSSDATADIARRTSVRHLSVDVVEVTFADGDAHAARARRYAMDLCAGRLPDGGVIMTTDADSRVDRGWIAAMLVEIDSGNDAVAGVVTFDAATDPGTAVDASLERAQEWQLAHLHAQLHTLLDPRPQEQWPTHIWAWGASLAVTATADRAVGGLPEVPLAEDRAFADMLDRRGFRVRRSHAPIVYTSARQTGRAPGGFADLLRGYASDPAALCDAAIEPTADLVRRLRWRSHLRRSHAHAGPRLCDRASTRLQIPSVAGGDEFGEWWHAIEAASPRLRRQRVRPAMLAGELRRARRIIARIEAAREDRSGTRRSCGGTQPAGG